jgi:putative membrane protein
MSQEISYRNDQKVLYVVGILALVVPALVAYLILGNKATRIEGLDVSFLPHLNAFLNSSTSFLLILGLFFIKRKQILVHRAVMMTAFTLSAVFLISYVIYHNNADSTKFGGVDTIRMIYFFLLISHILLSVAVVPLVLLSLYFAWTNQIIRHKKIVRFAYPVWLYVSVSGVLVYLLISPYYTH